MARISQLFEIEVLEGPERPRQKHEISIFINKEWYRLSWKPEILETYKHLPVILDADLLNEKVLKEILNIKDVRTDQRIKYVEGQKGLDELRIKTIKNEHRVGFCLYPVSIEDLMKIADANFVLPPKSTWFEPRLKNGLIVQEL